MERKHISAYTEVGTSYPAFISLNREADGRLTLTARERGHAGEKVVNVDITPEALEVFVTDALAYLHGA